VPGFSVRSNSPRSVVSGVSLTSKSSRGEDLLKQKLSQLTAENQLLADDIRAGATP